MSTSLLKLGITFAFLLAAASAIVLPNIAPGEPGLGRSLSGVGSPYVGYSGYASNYRPFQSQSNSGDEVNQDIENYHQNDHHLISTEDDNAVDYDKNANNDNTHFASSTFSKRNIGASGSCLNCRSLCNGIAPTYGRYGMYGTYGTYRPYNTATRYNNVGAGGRCLKLRSLYDGLAPTYRPYEAATGLNNDFDLYNERFHEKSHQQQYAENDDNVDYDKADVNIHQNNMQSTFV